MTRLPQVRGNDLIRALKRAGFEQRRQRGSHVILCHSDDPSRRVTVPVHKGKNVRLGTLRAILKGARLTVDELLTLL